jgi:hypothetical protein
MHYRLADSLLCFGIRAGGVSARHNIDFDVGE